MSLYLFIYARAEYSVSFSLLISFQCQTWPLTKKTCEETDRLLDEMSEEGSEQDHHPLVKND